MPITTGRRRDHWLEPARRGGVHPVSTRRLSPCDRERDEERDDSEDGELVLPGPLTRMRKGGRRGVTRLPVGNAVSIVRLTPPSRLNQPVRLGVVTLRLRRSCLGLGLLALVSRPILCWWLSGVGVTVLGGEVGVLLAGVAAVAVGVRVLGRSQGAGRRVVTWLG